MHKMVGEDNTVLRHPFGIDLVSVCYGYFGRHRFRRRRRVRVVGKRRNLFAEAHEFFGHRLEVLNY